MSKLHSGNEQCSPSQHFIFNVNNELPAAGKVGVGHRGLFEFGETPRAALLIQHLLLLRALRFELRFVPLIVNTGEYEDIEDEEAAADGDRHAQRGGIRAVSVEQNIY